MVAQRSPRYGRTASECSVNPPPDHSLHIVAIGVEDIGREVAPPVIRPQPRRPIANPARRQRRRIERPDGSLCLSGDGDVQRRHRRPGFDQPKRQCWSP